MGNALLWPNIFCLLPFQTQQNKTTTLYSLDFFFFFLKMLRLIFCCLAW